ncbi:MAG: hypothetical protein IPJ69_12830 [Deltaproteobacteria bacterium]|nr:MAG: hypothetical protein IPJ69_12830 [Deltaproteobacteria bacterium]
MSPPVHGHHRARHRRIETNTSSEQHEGLRQPIPSLDISFGRQARDIFQEASQHVQLIANLPFSLPAGAHSNATGLASPHCIENSGRSVLEYVRGRTQSTAAFTSFVRDAAHQVVDTGTHDIILSAGLKPGRYANGLEIPAGENGQTGATYTMRLGVHNGRLTGRITVTPFLIQHAPGIPGTSWHLPNFVTAQITSIDISQDAHGRIQFSGNILGSPVVMPITDQVTPMLFGTAEPVLISTPSALTERIINYYTDAAHPERARGVNMVDPNTIALSLASNINAATSPNITTLPTLHLGPMTLTGLNLGAQFEARPSESGFVLRIPHTGFRELRIHTDARCGAEATPDTTLTNAGISDLALDIRHRDSDDNSNIPFYLHSFSANVSSGALNVNGDITAQATDNAPITLAASGTQAGRVTLTVNTPAQEVNTNVSAFGHPINTTNINPSATTYTINIPNVFDPLHTVATLTSDSSSLRVQGLSVGDPSTFQANVSGLSSDTHQLNVSASLGGFNPLALLGLDFSHLTYDQVLSTLGSSDPFVDVRVGSVNSQLAAINAVVATDGSGSLSTRDHTTLRDIMFRISGQTGIRLALGASLPSSAISAQYHGSGGQSGRQLDVGIASNNPLDLDVNVGISRTGQIDLNGTHLTGLDATTDFTASTDFLNWIQHETSPGIVRFMDALSRRILPSPSTLRTLGITTPRNIAFRSRLQTRGNGIAISTGDHGHTHNLNTSLVARTSNHPRHPRTSFASNDIIDARLAVVDRETHGGLALPRPAILAGNNRLDVTHRLNARAPEGSLAMSGHLTIADRNDGTLQAQDHGVLKIPALGINNTSDLRLSTILTTEGQGYTGVPSVIDISGSLDSDGSSRERVIAGATLAGGLTVHNNFRLRIPTAAPSHLTFHARGTSDLRLNAGLGTGEGNGRVNLAFSDHANSTASVASPARVGMDNSSTVRVTTDGDIQAMTPAGEVRVLNGVDIPVETQGGGVRVQVNSIDGTARALRAWGVGAPEGRTGRRGTPHGSR